jgi:hypothetical protein
MWPLDNTAPRKASLGAVKLEPPCALLGADMRQRDVSFCPKSRGCVSLLKDLSKGTLKIGSGAWASPTLGGVGANQTVAAEGTGEGECASTRSGISQSEQRREASKELFAGG